MSHVHLLEVGIVDALGVVEQALRDAVSVSSMLMTTENMIVDLPRVEGIDQSVLGDEFDETYMKQA